VGSTNLARNYDGFGRVSDIAAGVGANPVSLSNAHYTFDALGNLTQRAESVLNPVTQSFAYDPVDRLTSYAGQSAAYDAAGNLTSRAGTGYSYQAGSHRMTGYGSTGYGYDANGNVTSISGGTTRTLTPTAFNLPATIVQGTTSLAYVYDGGHKRIKETSASAGGTTTTWYLGSYEEITRTDGVTERRHWIQTPDGTAGIYTSRSDGTTAPRYWLTDHLGSVVGEVDQAGVLKQSASFGAWGDRTQVVQADPRAEDRGYTGHEHLTEVNLVHMNGRVYDPVTGRFLAADPLIQDPLDAQSYNRYSYVKNNPLSFTDPSGFSWWTKWRKPVIAIAIAWAVPQLAMYMASEMTLAGAMAEGVGGFEAGLAATEAAAAVQPAASVAGGFAAGGVQGGNMESAVAGAISAGLFYGAGSLADAAVANGVSGFGSGGLGRVALHAAVGCASGAAAGGSCRQQAAAAGFGELAGPVISLGDNNVAYGIVAHAVAGGVGAKLAGGKFENGAVTGAFGYLFNCGAHDCWDRKYSDLPGELRDAARSLSDRIDASGNAEWTKIKDRMTITYENRWTTDFAGDTMLADAGRGSIRFFRGSLFVTDKAFLMAHEFAHLIPGSEAFPSTGDFLRNPSVPAYELGADAWASRFLNRPVPRDMRTYQDRAQSLR
jgi:RHS repeat-associated protein